MRATLLQSRAAMGLGARATAPRAARLFAGRGARASMVPPRVINATPSYGWGSRAGAARPPLACASKGSKGISDADVGIVPEIVELGNEESMDDPREVDVIPTASVKDMLEEYGKNHPKAIKKAKKKAKKKLEKAAQKVQGYPSFRAKWSDIKGSLRPCQAALGWDWAIFKMQKITTKEDAQKYMDIKPVPCVKRGKKWYTVDHHHTLVALEMSGFDVEVTIYEIMEIEKDGRSIESFWGYMEGKGWAFICDRNYQRKEGAWTTLPKSWDIRQFRNDIYRSMGGFSRVHKCLSRGERLEDQLFFEFRWAYFFHLHRDDEFGMWGDSRIHRAWLRLLRLVEETDMQEYLLDELEGGNHELANVASSVKLSQQIIEPTYQMLIYYLRHLCYAYDNLEGADRDVPGLRNIFGPECRTLPGTVLVDTDELANAIIVDALQQSNAASQVSISTGEPL